MKTLKITLLLALFVTVSSQTGKTTSDKEVENQKISIQKSKKMEVDLLAHIVRGVRIPTQG